MAETASSVSRPRVLSGMRPTGKLHLGNYMGALANWVKLQDDYECYFFIADWHALTTDYADPWLIKRNVSDVALDYLAAGIDPEKSVLFVQSHVPQHAELHLLLSMITSLGWLERVPTYKEQLANLQGKDLTTYGFLGYPLLQSADILLYQPKFVPVGQDQVSHVELTREVARRFNQLYCRTGTTLDIAPIAGHDSWGEAYSYREVLPEPQVLLTPSPKLPGTDGRKMSKIYGNTIGLTDSVTEVAEKLEKMTNGGQRNYISDPGNPEICPVYDLHKLFSSEEVKQHAGSGCRKAAISCTECKRLAARSISARLGPIQRKRSQYEIQPDLVEQILAEGAHRARIRAEQTMQEVRIAMGMSGTIASPSITVFQRLSADTGTPIRHSLKNHCDMWDAPVETRRDFLIAYWKDRMAPSEFALRQDGPRLFITPRGKRVLVSTAREKNPGDFTFYIPRKSYEVLVLLAWGKGEERILKDFVIPQKLYRSHWAELPKGKDEVRVRLTCIGESCSLYLGESRIDVSAFVGDYHPMQ